MNKNKILLINMIGFFAGFFTAWINQMYKDFKDYKNKNKKLK